MSLNPADSADADTLPNHLRDLAHLDALEAVREAREQAEADPFTRAETWEEANDAQRRTGL